MLQVVDAFHQRQSEINSHFPEISKESPTPMMQGPEETHHLPSEGRKQENEEDDALMSFTIQMKKDNLKEHGDGKTYFDEKYDPLLSLAEVQIDGQHGTLTPLPFLKGLI